MGKIYSIAIAIGAGLIALSSMDILPAAGYIFGGLLTIGPLLDMLLRKDEKVTTAPPSRVDVQKEKLKHKEEEILKNKGRLDSLDENYEEAKKNAEQVFKDNVDNGPDVVDITDKLESIRSRFED